MINFDVPRELPTYIARVGRCGRAGWPGTATTYVVAHDRLDREVMPALVHSLRELGLPVEPYMDQMAVQARLEAHPVFREPISLTTPFERLFVVADISVDSARFDPQAPSAVYSVSQAAPTTI